MRQVYFIFQEGNDRICKIGKSIDAEKRVIQLQTGNPNKLELYETLDGYTELENELHKRFNDKRIDGTEWFNLSKDEVDSLIEEYNEIYDEIDEESEEKELIEEVIEETKITKRTFRVKKETYVCDKCDQTFTEKRYLTRHTKNKTCEKVFTCNKCGEHFANRRNKDNHMRRKTPCTSTEDPLIDSTDSENKCKFCGKLYATGFTLKRHDSTCPMKNSQTILMDLIEQQQSQILMQQKQIGKLINANLK